MHNRNYVLKWVLFFVLFYESIKRDMQWLLCVIILLLLPETFLICQSLLVFRFLFTCYPDNSPPVVQVSVGCSLFHHTVELWFKLLHCFGCTETRVTRLHVPYNIQFNSYNIIWKAVTRACTCFNSLGTLHKLVGIWGRQQTDVVRVLITLGFLVADFIFWSDNIFHLCHVFSVAASLETLKFSSPWEMKTIIRLFQINITCHIWNWTFQLKRWMLCCDIYKKQNQNAVTYCASLLHQKGKL